MKNNYYCRNGEKVDSFNSRNNSKISNNISRGSKNEDDNNSKAGKPKVILDRSQLMDNMLFPENCASLVIVPSNKEGTGFLNHCYDERFLKEYIAEKEFNAIVMIASKLAAKCYSKKKLLDKKGVDRSMKLILIVATLLAIVSLYTVLEGFVGGEDKTLLYFSHVLIAPSLISVFVVSIVNWKQKVVKPVTFNEMVKKDMDEFFSKINPEFKHQGIEWATIEGHYWLEIRLSPQKKQGSLKQNLQRNLSKKLKKILMSADIQVSEKLINTLEQNDQLGENEEIHNQQDQIGQQENLNSNRNLSSRNKYEVDDQQIDTEQQQLVEDNDQFDPNFIQN